MVAYIQIPREKQRSLRSN